jgi:glycosyltransferase involved in cell wall biosynthesis
MTGLVSEEEKRRLLAESWILVNTSVHEGLPISFLEALAHRTALLSYENPDEYVSRFGYHVREDSLECLGVGLEGLLKDDLWREKAEAGYVYVRENHDADKIIRMLVEIYKGLL